MSFLDVLADKLHGSIGRYDEVKNYLHSRGVTDEEIENFKIGYAKYVSVPPEESEDHERFLADAWKGKAFENKIIFPLHDILGRTMGIIGRSMDRKEYKKFLTEEGKFQGAFFGLVQALPAVYETGRVFVLEGPFDLLSFSKVYKNSVAALTAGISDAQIEVLEMFATSIVTVFDHDNAGETAARKTKEKWHFKIDNIDLGWKDCNKMLMDQGLDWFTKFVKNKVERKFLF